MTFVNHITPEQVRAARAAAGLTQAAAAEMVHCARRTWQDWEAGKRKMPRGLWELFNLLASHPATKAQAPSQPS